MAKAIALGEKVYWRSPGVAYTVKLISNDSALIEGYGTQHIAKLSELKSITHVASDGWFVFDAIPGMAYRVKWVAQGIPNLVQAFNFRTQEFEEAPKVNYFNPMTVFDTAEFKPVKLTTTTRMD